MKVKEVPQELRFFKDTIVRDVVYAVDDDGNYTSVVSEGWNIKNDALDIIWNDIDEKCETIRKKVLAGETSPLAYHLEKNIMNIDLFAKYTGQSKRKIKQHLEVNGFKKLDDNVLLQYAEVLRISVEELKTI